MQQSPFLRKTQPKGKITPFKPANTMLINETYLAKYSPLPKNYDFSEVMGYVDIAELIWIKPLIGDDFYDELCEQVENNQLTEENATALVEAIWPYLGFAVVYEALPSIAFHISEVSVTKGKSDNSDPLSLKELTYFQTHLRGQVEARKDFAKKWFCEHQDSFPLLDICNCGCSGCYEGLLGKLNKPNPLFEVYTNLRKPTALK